MARLPWKFGRGTKNHTKNLADKGLDALMPASVYRLLTASASDFAEGSCTRSLIVGTAGTANITTPDNVDIDNFPLFEGYNPVAIRKLRALGTAANVYGVFE